VELVYDEFHARAQQYMRRERPGHTLQPTSLVHETYLRLVRDNAAEWQNRAHFFATASIVMRRILVDHARARAAAAKRPGAGQRVQLDSFMAAQNPRIEQLPIPDEALTHLSRMDARQARVVELICFGGLTEEEAAEVLGISVRTVKRDWSDARAWLQAKLQPKLQAEFKRPHP
jgi:RNA polymerase sigma factor (TIGR02999 family)